VGLITVSVSSSNSALCNVVLNHSILAYLPGLGTWLVPSKIEARHWCIVEVEKSNQIISFYDSCPVNSEIYFKIGASLNEALGGDYLIMDVLQVGESRQVEDSAMEMLRYLE